MDPQFIIILTYLSMSMPRVADQRGHLCVMKALGTLGPKVSSNNFQFHTSAVLHRVDPSPGTSRNASCRTTSHIEIGIAFIGPADNLKTMHYGRGGRRSREDYTTITAKSYLRRS